MTISLDLALYRLLHERAYRRKLVEGRFDELELSEEDARHLRHVDTAELQSHAEMICRNLTRGELEYEGGLRSAMPGVVQALSEREEGVTEVMYRFVESSHYWEYRQVPFAGEGCSIEEAFYSFLLEDDDFLGASPHHRWLLTHEFLGAMMKLLTLNTTPSFSLRTPLIRANGVARYALQRYPADFVRMLGVSPGEQEHPTFLYATNGKRFVRGPISPLVAPLLEAGSWAALSGREEQLAREQGVAPERLQLLAQGLQQLGLIA